MKLTVNQLIETGVSKLQSEYIMSISNKLGAAKSFQTRDKDNRNRNIRFLDVSLAIEKIEEYLTTATHNKAILSFPKKREALIILRDLYAINEQTT